MWSSNHQVPGFMTSHHHHKFLQDQQQQQFLQQRTGWSQRNRFHSPYLTLEQERIQLQLQQNQLLLEQQKQKEQQLQHRIRQPLLQQPNREVPPSWLRTPVVQREASNFHQVNYPRPELYREMPSRQDFAYIQGGNSKDIPYWQGGNNRSTFRNGWNNYNGTRTTVETLNEVKNQHPRYRRCNTPGPVTNRSHPYSRNQRSRSLGPDDRQRFYRSKSVDSGPWRQRDSFSRPAWDSDIGRNKMPVTSNNFETGYNTSKKSDRGMEKQKEGHRRENMRDVVINRKINTSPQKEVRCITENRKIPQLSTTENNACGFNKVRDIERTTRISPSSHQQKTKMSPKVNSFTGITRTVSNFPQESNLKRKVSDSMEESLLINRKWKTLKPYNGSNNSTETVTLVKNSRSSVLNQDSSALNNITRTLINVPSEKIHTYTIGERNRRLRSFRQEEEEVEEEQEEEDRVTLDNYGQQYELEEDETENNEYEKEDNAKQQERDARTTENTYNLEEDENSKEEKIPEYNSKIPIGRSLLKWTVGLRCRTCNRFFLAPQEAQEHCRTREHYDNYVKRIKELQYALNLDPMDGPKALELERLFEDEPPSETPPKFFFS